MDFSRHPVLSFEIPTFVHVVGAVRDWKAAGHTPRLASVKFITVKKIVNRFSDRGMAPTNTGLV
jgi:hypothetical protein